MSEIGTLSEGSGWTPRASGYSFELLVKNFCDPSPSSERTKSKASSLRSLDSSTPTLVSSISEPSPPGGLGSLMLLTSVGVLDSSDRKEEALGFVRSLLSPASQAFFTSSSKEYPLARDAKADPSLTVPIEEIPASGSELVDLKELQATIDLMKESGAL